MRFKAAIVFLVLTLIACQKEGGKYCPLLTSTNTGPLVDLAPVRDIPQIMDTLKKYPQLQVFRLNAGKGYDPGSFWANVSCRVYYSGLQIFRTEYYFRYSTFPSEYNGTEGHIPLQLDLSLEPGFSRDEAIRIAKENQTFEHCPFTQLGLTNVGSPSQPSYKLSWRITGAESGYPIVEIDAQNKNILYSDDGIRYYQ